MEGEGKGDGHQHEQKPRIPELVPIALETHLWALSLWSNGWMDGSHSVTLCPSSCLSLSVFTHASQDSLACQSRQSSSPSLITIVTLSQTTGLSFTGLRCTVKTNQLKISSQCQRTELIPKCRANDSHRSPCL